MIFPTVVSAAGLVNNAINVLKSARDLARDSSDSELKEKIGEVFDVLFDLRERVLTLDEENRILRAEVEAKAIYIGPVPPHGYYYASKDKAEEHPLCPTCYQSSPQKIGFLENVEPWNGGLRRVCKLCGHSIYEKPLNLTLGRVAPRVSRQY